jgi:hypothetical protein
MWVLHGVASVWDGTQPARFWSHLQEACLNDRRFVAPLEVALHKGHLGLVAKALGMEITGRSSPAAILRDMPSRGVLRLLQDVRRVGPGLSSATSRGADQSRGGDGHQY